MASLPPRYGDDTWYAVIGYEGDPHILAYRRDHPDHITVPLRWKNPPPRQDTPDPPPPRPPAPGRWATRADPVRLPRPDEMLTVAELKAIMAEARAASAPGRGPDDLLIPVQGNRGPRGPRPVGPPGARRDWTAQELWNQHRIDIARTRLAELEPRNPMLQSLEPAGTPPTPRMADAMEAELIAARGRGSRGDSENQPQAVAPDAGTRANGLDQVSIRDRPGVATYTLLPRVEGRWLRGSEGNLGLIPSQIAERLNGRSFADWKAFREAFWIEVGNDPALSSQFSRANRTLMQQGRAPYASPSQTFGTHDTLVLHHRQPLSRGGSLYDMDHVVVVTPLMTKVCYLHRITSEEGQDEQGRIDLHRRAPLCCRG